MGYTRPSGVGFIDPNFPNPNGPDDASIIIYGYTPNFTLCILGIIFFSLAFLLHFIQVCTYRLWSFTPLTIACLLEIIGYAFRSLSSHQDPYRITYFVVQYFLIVTAPVLVSASIYVCLTRLLAWAESNGTKFRGWWMGKRAILWTFISIDVVTTAMQVTGAAMIGAATSNQKDPSTANNILLSGLAMQSAAFLVFLILLTVVIVGIWRNKELVVRLHKRRSPFILILMIASLLVFMRTLFRLVETSEGVFGHMSTHEAFFGGLEFAPMVGAVFLLGIWHPGRWMSNTERERKVEGA